MQTDGIIFDVDGTLWNATTQIVEAYNVILKERKIDKVITLEDMKPMMGLMNEEIADHLFSFLDKDQRMELMDTCCQYENMHLAQYGGILYPHVKDVLNQLAKQYPLYIVSNCQDGYIETLFQVHELTSLFQDYESSGRTGKTKAENLCDIVKRNHLQKPVYIGDTQKDQDACKAAGIPFIYASYGFGKINEKAIEIKGINELLAIFYGS